MLLGLALLVYGGGDPINGGRVYDDFTKKDAGGTGTAPTGAPNREFYRCKACHGWDALGTQGGYVDRLSTAVRPSPNRTTSAAAGCEGISYIRSSNPECSHYTVGAVGTGLVTGLVFNGANTTTGGTLYTANCAGCHGANGKRIDLEGVTGRGIGGYVRTAGNFGKYAELFQKMYHGELDTTMTRAAQGNLTLEQTRDISAYIQANDGTIFID